MIHAHVAGELLASPERRTSERGTEWLRLKLRCPAGSGHALVTAAAFDGAIVERLAGLKPGDAVSLAGPLRCFAPRPSPPARRSQNGLPIPTRHLGLVRSPPSSCTRCGGRFPTVSTASPPYRGGEKMFGAIGLGTAAHPIFNAYSAFRPPHARNRRLELELTRFCGRDAV
jgi:hypothetical protein